MFAAILRAPIYFFDSNPVGKPFFLWCNVVNGGDDFDESLNVGVCGFNQTCIVEV
jgi:hypothetical protein